MSILNIVCGVTGQVESLLKRYEAARETTNVPAPATTSGVIDSKQMPAGLIGAYGTSSFSLPSRYCMSDEPPIEASPSASKGTDEKESDGLLSASFSWEMIDLGLEEPLPAQDVLDDLYELRLSLRMIQANVFPGLKSISRRSTLLFP